MPKRGLTCQGLLAVAPARLRRSRIRKAPARCEKTLQPARAPPFRLRAGMAESTWLCGNKEVLLFACSFIGWQLRKSLSLILSFEGIKQAALMGGNSALKILPFVSKVFLLLLRGRCNQRWSLLARPGARCSFSQQVEQRSESEIRAATDTALSTNERCRVGSSFLMCSFLKPAFTQARHRLLWC